MPTGLLDADTGFPQFNGEETNGEKIAKIENYLFLLLENLRYSFSNLGVANFNGSSLDEIGQIITKPLIVRLENDEGDIASISATTTELTARMTTAEGNYSQLTQTVSGISATVAGHDGSIASLTTAVGNITLGVDGQGSSARLYLVKGDGETDNIALGLSVTNGEKSSSIQLTAGGVDIGASQTVQFTGNVVFKSNLTDGETEISGNNIKTGSISASRIGAGTLSGQTISGGTIKGSEFQCKLDSGSSFSSGNIDFYIDDYPSGDIMVFDNGLSSSALSRYGIMISANSYSGYSLALKLYSTGNMSLTTNNTIYLDAGTVAVTGTDSVGIKAPTITIGNEGSSAAIWLSGTVYINGKPHTS